MAAMARRAVGDRALVGLYVIGGCSAGAMIGMLNVVGFRLEGPAFGLGLGAASLVFLVYPLGSVAPPRSGGWPTGSDAGPCCRSAPWWPSAAPC